MAHMIPATISEQTESSAERKLFPVFRGGLDDSYTVFHSFNLLTKNRRGKFIDGEIDFLVFSPDKGFLVIEAKSGAIRYDGSTGTWYQNEQPLKRSPFAQAVHAKYQLLYFLEAHLGYTLQATFAHAVFFPDVFTEIGALPSGGEPEISLTGRDMQNAGKRVVEIFEAFQKEKTRPLNEKQVGEIRNILMPYCEYGTSLPDLLGKAKQQIFAVTENQCRYLEFIRRHSWAKIEGCAGSGKTVMAVKKARELATEGKSVLLLAYNRMIGEHLTKSVADMKNVKASTYHKFCMDKLREAGWLKEQPSYDPDFFDKQVPELYAKLMDKQPVQYDAVIVDEGQDFRIEYWVTIGNMVKPDGYFYIFYDPAQNVRITEMDFPITDEPFILSDNCRNTQRIYETLKPYARMEMRLVDGAPQGTAVVELVIQDDWERRKELGRILHRLINEQGLSRDQVVILGGHSLARTCIGNKPGLGNFIVTEGLEDKPNCVHYHTYMKFKGCEADAVIILDVDPEDERWEGEMGLYVAISRAQHLLYILRKK